MSNVAHYCRRAHVNLTNMSHQGVWPGMEKVALTQQRVSIEKGQHDLCERDFPAWVSTLSAAFDISLVTFDVLRCCVQWLSLLVMNINVQCVFQYSQPFQTETKINEFNWLCIMNKSPRQT